LEIPNFADYVNGDYFPPLVLDISGTQTLNGTSFGLFAAEDIESNCFIGEYAADILN
jgi:hypothetical protein